MALAICISILGLIAAPALVAILVWAVVGTLAAIADGFLESDSAPFIAAGLIALAGLLDLAALTALVWWIVHLWTGVFA